MLFFGYIWGITASAIPLSLDESLSLLDSNSPSTQLRRLLEEKQEVEAISMRNQLLPQARFEVSGMYFGDPLEVNLLGDGAEDVDCSSFEAFGMGDLCAGFSEPMTLREERIFDASAQILYPLSALYSIFQGYQASLSQVEATRHESEDLRRKLRVQFITLYTEAVVLQYTIEFLKETEKRVEEHQKNISSMIVQGLLSEIESSRIEIAQHEIRLSQKEAADGYRMLCAQLMILTGEKIEPQKIESFAVRELLEEQHPRENVLIQQQKSVSMASKAALGSLLPEVVLVGATTRTGGQGDLTPTSQSYVGLSVRGTFSWGKKWGAYQNTKKDISMLTLSREIDEKQLQIERETVHNKITRMKMKSEIADKKISFAKENLRHTNALFTQQIKTTIDLLDAETALLEALLYQEQGTAKFIQSIAEYEYLMGYVPFEQEKK
jgi:outer membrane protein TolC